MDVAHSWLSCNIQLEKQVRVSIFLFNNAQIVRSDIPIPIYVLRNVVTGLFVIHPDKGFHLVRKDTFRKFKIQANKTIGSGEPQRIVS